MLRLNGTANGRPTSLRKSVFDTKAGEVQSSLCASVVGFLHHQDAYAFSFCAHRPPSLDMELVGKQAHSMKGLSSAFQTASVPTVLAQVQMHDPEWEDIKRDSKPLSLVKLLKKLTTQHGQEQCLVKTAYNHSLNAQGFQQCPISEAQPVLWTVQHQDRHSQISWH